MPAPDRPGSPSPGEPLTAFAQEQDLPAATRWQSSKIRHHFEGPSSRWCRTTSYVHTCWQAGTAGMTPPAQHCGHAAAFVHAGNDARLYPCMNISLRLCAATAASALLLAACSSTTVDSGSGTPAGSQPQSSSPGVNPGDVTSGLPDPIGTPQTDAPADPLAVSPPSDDAQTADAQAAEQWAVEAGKTAMVLSQQLMAFASQYSAKQRNIAADQPDMQLFEFLAVEPESWAAGAKLLLVEADNRGVKASVEGVPLASLTASSFNLKDGVSVTVVSGQNECKVNAVFVPGKLVTMSWEGPTCTAVKTAPAAAPASSSSASPAAVDASPAAVDASPAQP